MRQKIHKRKVSFSKIQFLTFICIFAATGGYWLLSSHAATIWYVSTSGSGTVCSQAQPCASFDQAYQNASTGDTVQVAAGTYSSQSISSSNANISGMVTFQPCNGCSVIVQGISISSPWITINNMTSYPGDNHEVKTGPNQALGVMVSSSNVTLNNVNSKGAYVWDMIYNSTNIIWNGGEVLTPGVVGLRDCLGTDNDQLPLSILGGTNITLDSMHFHVAASSQQACTNGNQSSNGVHLEM
ncbi:MAG TPA: hypothetical protein VFP32_00615, partial [Candidatus Saccharimonadales bacterium]|nr:hypothetical protein [Candidatus Saccharimonadales bacterium]